MQKKKQVITYFNKYFWKNYLGANLDFINFVK